MGHDRIGHRYRAIHVVSVAAVLASLALAMLFRSGVAASVVSPLDRSNTDRVVHVALSQEMRAKEEAFNKGLPLKVDNYTTLQRVDFKKGYWNFHFKVTYYILKVDEFERKKHASAIGDLCMDKSFVQSLKESGPFLYEYLDPSGQTGDVMLPKEDCGE